MIFALGTKNPAKIEGARRALTRFFPGFELRTLDATSVSRAQPMGLEQISQGAIGRAKFALESPGSDLGVGVEAGIFKLAGTYFDHQQAAILDHAGKVSLGHSTGFALPTVAVEKMLREGKELEQYATELTGIDAIGEKGGIISYLTSGAISRTDLTEQCVTAALIPWVNKTAYGF